MHTVELTLVLLLIVAVGGALVRWTHMGLPIFLVVTGVAASFLPGLDRLTIDPGLFLLLFVPPLLYADARSLPRRDLLPVLQPRRLPAQRLIKLGVDDPALQTRLSLLTPHAACLAAEGLHVSGVLAAVLAGLRAGGRG